MFVATIAVALVSAFTPVESRAARIDSPVSLPAESLPTEQPNSREEITPEDARDLAIATLLYSTVAARSCNGVSLSEGTYQAFMTDNNLSDADIDANGPRGDEIKESVATLEELFREENKAACDTAWMFMGAEGYLARGLLVGTATANQAEPASNRSAASRRLRR
jgi:hypothetical protein